MHMMLELYGLNYGSLINDSQQGRKIPSSYFDIQHHYHKCLCNPFYDGRHSVLVFPRQGTSLDANSKCRASCKRPESRNQMRTQFPRIIHRLVAKVQWDKTKESYFDINMYIQQKKS